MENINNTDMDFEVDSETKKEIKDKTSNAKANKTKIINKKHVSPFIINQSIENTVIMIKVVSIRTTFLFIGFLTMKLGLYVISSGI